MIYQYCLNIKNIKNVEEIIILQDFISSKRKNKIHKFRFDKDKIRCLLSSILLRYALVKHYNFKNEDIMIGYGLFGKPFLEKNDSLHFNISHSGDWIVCAVGNGKIGVDVEVIKEMEMKQISYFFSRGEQEWLKSKKETQKMEMFYKLWTLKESYMKYIGTGLGYSLDRFSIELVDESIKVYEGNNYINVHFWSDKLDSNHWYALCTNLTDVKCEMIKIDYEVILDFFCRLT